LKANASFSYSGWGPAVQASFTMESSSNYSKSEVHFVAKRTILHGFEGYQNGAFPSFSDEAKSVL